LSTFLSPIGSGFGDVLISLPVMQALLDRGEDVCLVIRSFRQEGIGERIIGLSGAVREEDLQIGPGDKYFNLRAHPIQTDHLWGTPEFEKIFGVTRIEKIITLIAADYGLDISYQNLRPLRFELRPEIVGRVLFVPGTDGHFKHWPKEYWLELQNGLEKNGLEITLVGRPEESPAVRELIDSGMQWLATPTAGDAIDVVSSALAVVAVDTGLMHAAIQQNIPTFSFVHPDMFHHRTAVNSFQFIGVHCPAECGRDTELKPGITNASCLDVNLKFQSHSCPLALEHGFTPPTKRSSLPGPFNCMSGITPDAVLETIKKQCLISPPKN
jgi:hypothetical protein